MMPRLGMVEVAYGSLTQERRRAFTPRRVRRGWLKRAQRHALVYWQSTKIDRVLATCEPHAEELDPALPAHSSAIGCGDLLLDGAYRLDHPHVRPPRTGGARRHPSNQGNTPPQKTSGLIP